MSVIWAEGFDDGIMRGGLGGNNLPTVQTTAPRTGTRSLRAVTGSNGFTSVYTMPHAALATGFTSFGMNMASIVGGQIIWSGYDNATQHIYLVLRSDGKFEVFRSGGTSLGAGTYVYTAGTYVHLSFKWTISDAAGVFELRINGATTPDINLSAIDTRNAANAQLTQQQVGMLNSGVNATGVNLYIDDIVLQDTNGSAPENSWLGETEVAYLFANGAGDDADFALGGSAPAASTYESWDEVPVNDGVDMVTSATVGDKANTAFSDLSGAGTIYAVVGLMRAKKAAAGTRNVKQSIKVSGTEVLGSEHALSTSWLTYQNVWHRDPSNAVWTTTNVNGIKAGVENV